MKEILRMLGSKPPISHLVPTKGCSCCPLHLLILLVESIAADHGYSPQILQAGEVNRWTDSFASDCTCSMLLAQTAVWHGHLSISTSSACLIYTQCIWVAHSLENSSVSVLCHNAAPQLSCQKRKHFQCGFLWICSLASTIVHVQHNCSEKEISSPNSILICDWEQIKGNIQT